MTETKREIWPKEKGKKKKKTHRSSVGRERIAHDIRITGHSRLPSKAIRAISIDRPREVWMINGLIGSKSHCYNFPY